MPRIVIVTFIFGLLSATSTAQATSRQGVDAGETAAGNPDKIICKRFVRIGSLVDGYRTCKTKKEWERERADHQDLGKAYSCEMFDGAAAPCK